VNRHFGTLVSLDILIMLKCLLTWLLEKTAAVGCIVVE